MDDIKASEERKRDKAYDPVLRWKHIQETITWAEANMPPHLRRNRPRQPKDWYLRESTRKLGTELEKGTLENISQKVNEISSHEPTP